MHGKRRSAAEAKEFVRCVARVTFHAESRSPEDENVNGTKHSYARRRNNDEDDDQRETGHGDRDTRVRNNNKTGPDWVVDVGGGCGGRGRSVGRRCAHHGINADHRCYATRRPRFAGSGRRQGDVTLAGTGAPCALRPKSRYPRLLVPQLFFYCNL